MNYASQLSWIQNMQQVLRSRPMDLFFLGWDHVDSMGFTILVVSFVLFFINRKIGLKLFYIFMINAVFIIFLKDFFGLPRPCQVDPSVGLKCPSSYGFPSGAAQSAIVYAGVLWYECKKRPWRIVGVLFALFLCFSRLYLGVHYITDILGGLAFGAVSLCLYIWVFPLCENKWKTWAFLVPLFPFFFLREKAWVFPLIFLGTGLGLLFTFKLPKTRPCQTAGFLITALGALLCFWSSLHWPQYNFFFTLLGGFWITFLGGYSAQRFCGTTRS